MFSSTNTFGQSSSSPTFGSSSTPAFGSSVPAFGASSTPAFGNGSSPFGGSSAFGQKPAFGGFGATPSQASPFGNTFQQTQPAFGNKLFGSFGASSQPAFGSTSAPAFGMTSTPAFGSSTPAFGSSSTPLFGPSSSAFGASSSPSFNFGSSPSFGQSNSAFGSQVATPSFGSRAFGQSNFGGQCGGSRVAAYSPTAEVDGGSSTQPAGKLESVSAMTVYKEKSHEELRWEDYQLGDTGGPNPAAQPAGFGTPAAQSNCFGGSSTSNAFGGSSPSNTFGGTNTFGNPSTNPFSSTFATSSNLFASKPSTFGTSGFGPTFSSPPFGSSSSTNSFGTNSSSTPSLFPTSTPAFGSSSSPSIFAAPSSSTAFGFSPSVFGSTSASGTTSPFDSGLNFPNTQLAGQTTSPSLGQTTSPFGHTSSAFGQSTPSFGQTNMFSTPTTGFGFRSSSTPSLFPTNNQGFMMAEHPMYSPTILDQHRDMRLDVDNMSYEELLALEERIGNVSIGSSEDTMSKGWRESIYYTYNCVICLEEYENKDVVATLTNCGHNYHSSCLKKWLSMKKVCPICKAPVVADS